MKSNLIFKAAEGSHLSDKKAPAYGAFLMKLANKNKVGGIPGLSKEIVVTAAMPETSPIHECFEWDNTEAAHKYRLEQARHLLKSIVVVRNTTGNPHDEAEEVRAFHFVRVSKENTAFVPQNIVFEREDLTSQAVSAALHEISVWRNRYRVYSQLAGICNAIDDAVETYQAATAQPTSTGSA